MKKLINKIIDYCFYQFLIDVLQEVFRVDLILIDADKNFIKQINMNYVPISGSFIQLPEGSFEITKVIHATYGAVAHLEGKLL